MSQGKVDPQMQNFLEEENRRVMFNDMVSNLASVCFDKCVSTPGSSLGRSESSCLSKCALRYLEAGEVVLRRIQGDRE